MESAAEKYGAPWERSQTFIPKGAQEVNLPAPQGFSLGKKINLRVQQDPLSFPVATPAEETENEPPSPPDPLPEKKPAPAPKEPKIGWFARLLGRFRSAPRVPDEVATLVRKVEALVERDTKVRDLEEENRALVRTVARLQREIDRLKTIPHHIP